MKRVFIVHGWAGYPEEGWFPYLKKELERRDFKVTVPKMPDPSHPKIERWVSYLKGLTTDTDYRTYFVGHSIGCQTILRLLEGFNRKAGGVVLVAPWMSLTPQAISKPSDRAIVKPWIKTPINFQKVKNMAKKFTAIFSDDDPYVPLEQNRRLFEDKLGAQIIIEHDMKHFSGEDNIFKLPSALSSIIELSK